jgi:hypothetical protein
MQHHFKDAQSSPSDITITEDATSVDISSITDLINVITVRVVQTSGTRNDPCKLKTRTWWDENVINAEDNMKGWPAFCMRWGSTILLDRPAPSGVKLRLRVTTKQTFTDDNTVCPIALLAIFVEQYVTAGVYTDLENFESARFWSRQALGVQYELNGKVGGQLANAINTDGIGDTALDLTSGRPGVLRPDGIAVRNLIVGHDDYGNIRLWQ